MIPVGTKVHQSNKISLADVQRFARPGDSAATIVANQHCSQWAIFSNGSAIVCEPVVGAVDKVMVFGELQEAIDALFFAGIETFTIQCRPALDFSPT